MAKVQTYYSEAEDFLEKNNLLFSQIGTVLDLWGFCEVDRQTGKPKVLVLPSKRIYERAQALGWQPPAQILDTDTTVHEAWQVMVEREQGYVPYSLWLLPIDAQKMLEWASLQSLTVSNKSGKFIAKDLYYQTHDQLRRVMNAYLSNMPHRLMWGLNRTLNDATILISAHFDTFYYVHKEHDIKLLLLDYAWEVAKSGGVVSDKWLGSFLTDPIMPEFLDRNPDFTFDKLAEMALKNQVEYEKTHQPMDEDCRVHEKFANGFFGLGRSFG